MLGILAAIPDAVRKYNKSSGRCPNQIPQKMPHSLFMFKPLTKLCVAFWISGFWISGLDHCIMNMHVAVPDRYTVILFSVITRVCIGGILGYWDIGSRQDDSQTARAPFGVPLWNHNTQHVDHDIDPLHKFVINKLEYN